MTWLSENLRVLKRIEEGKVVHVLALGASCTEHFMVGAHWFDYVNIGLMHKYRKWTSDRNSVYTNALCLDAGTSNHTTAELLERFDRDVAPFKPDLVILTSGANDSNPVRGISREQFRKNLEELRRRVNDLDGDVLFQTYYSCDLERFSELYPEWAANYAPYMKIICEVAGDYIIDNFTRWERLRKYNLPAYRLLMRDSLHLNPDGNGVIGLDLIRKLDLVLPDENLPWIKSAVFAQACMDLLEKNDKHE